MMPKKSVLIIDDDEISLLILQNALEIEKYNVVSTTNSLIATELFNQHNPDAVILDIFMPGKDGFELIRELRILSSKTFIVAISANEQYLRTIKALGANVALSKINMPDAVIDSIKLAV
jgi:CheY-like chemotaxis protein